MARSNWLGAGTAAARRRRTRLGVNGTVAAANDLRARSSRSGRATHVSGETCGGLGVGGERDGAMYSTAGLPLAMSRVATARAASKAARLQEIGGARPSRLRRSRLAAAAMRVPARDFPADAGVARTRCAPSSAARSCRAGSTSATCWRRAERREAHTRGTSDRPSALGGARRESGGGASMISGGAHRAGGLSAERGAPAHGRAFRRPASSSTLSPRPLPTRAPADADSAPSGGAARAFALAPGHVHAAGSSTARASARRLAA